MNYNWQHPSWPNFEYTLENAETLLYDYGKKVGRTVGILKGLDDELAKEAMLDRMVNEALFTSQIEGEHFNESDLRSSINSTLYNTLPTSEIHDERAFGVSKLVSFLHQNYQKDLNQETLFLWHKTLFEHSSYNLQKGKWRESPEPVRIISNHMGRMHISFEAPPATDIPLRMTRFLEWFNVESKTLPGPIRAALAHLYFESIHPFIDGNGRIGRAICEIALAQDMGYPCMIGLSKAIQKSQKVYYNELSKASSYTLSVSSWVNYFMKTLTEALIEAETDIHFVFKKSQFWKRHQNSINTRQDKVLKRMLSEGKAGLKDGITAQKYVTIAHCSKATATRDLKELLDLKALKKHDSGGRSTAYDVNLQ